jgi:hypothetical protein
MFSQLIPMLSEHCFHTVSTLSQHCLNTLSTLFPHCLNTVSTLSPHCLNTLSTLSQHCLKPSDQDFHTISTKSNRFHYPGWAPSPPIHKWRTPFSKGEHLHPLCSVNRQTRSAFVAYPQIICILAHATREGPSLCKQRCIVRSEKRQKRKKEEQKIDN